MTVQQYHEKEKKKIALAGVAQWLEHHPIIKGMRARFPVRARAWAVGHPHSGHGQFPVWAIPGLGMYGRQPSHASFSHGHFFLSLSKKANETCLGEDKKK